MLCACPFLGHEPTVISANTLKHGQEKTKTRLTVDDTGKVDIASTDSVAGDQAVAMVRELTQEAEIGKLYYGVVKRTVDFGAFVEIFPGAEGLVHRAKTASMARPRGMGALSE